jgi:xylan 1,4-beta-xylosidase
MTFAYTLKRCGLLMGFAALAAIASTFAQPAVETYQNPIIDTPSAADPAVIKCNGKYFHYLTLDDQSYDVFVSSDLVHWQRKSKCFTDHRGGLWAPDVFYNEQGDGKLCLYYTINNPGGNIKDSAIPLAKMIGVATADNPLGPFLDQGSLVFGAIDAHLFRDDDGSLCLYYVDLTGGFKIAVQRMSNLLTKHGRPIVLLSPTEPWERKQLSVTEAPWMLKQNGIYYLMFSGGGADSPDYSIGYATAKSPLGPFVKYSGNPIAHRGNGIFGPGHNCVVVGPDHHLWMLYHQKSDDRIDFDRFLALDPLWFDDQGVIHVKTTRGTEEPAP